MTSSSPEPTDPVEPHRTPDPYPQPSPYLQPSPYGQPPPYEPTRYADPGPYGQSAPYAQPTPYGQPTPYSQPTPYGQPAPYGQVVPYQDPRYAQYPPGAHPAAKSRLAAGLLAILIGELGIHNFYLGRTGVGLAQLLISVLSLGILAPLVWVWAIIEGILILTKSPSYATDRRGIPLRD